ncbi:hypothetical protein DB88DRAFT_476587 [Papiliotrema laurentii]|uniref:Oxysterol-binding protein n=1 Tax=Papiliotrema laurentii TaxID=5418 RepID=A0AAD9FVW6_PAPLA|nr:hypothetical protein DB88DRAFT_476587 [Papiliotrema laurentii]
MGLLGGMSGHLEGKTKLRSKSDASMMKPENGASGESTYDTTNLDKEEGNILMSIISQLRPGMDLSKIALPTFVLEPRSLLERITDFFSHPELIFGAGQEPDEKERFIRVMTYYLSGWHIKPKGVKKPYNPVLGEFFRCTYTYADGTEGYYVAEQVSHHPPVSAFFYVSPKNGLLVTGELKPKSRFLGNSAATIMEGEDRIRLLDRPEDGEYVITMPNTYARGILFGKMTLELCDASTITNATTQYHCDVDFKAKGWISGGYNVIEGAVKGPGEVSLGTVSGHWSDVMEYTDKKTGKKRVLFNPHHSHVVPKNVLPESEQEEYESRRLWTKLTDAIKAADMHGATAAKTAVEDRQRELVKQREATGSPPPPSRFFEHVEGDRWMPKIGVDSLPKDRDEMERRVSEWIFGDKSPTKPAQNEPPVEFYDEPDEPTQPTRSREASEPALYTPVEPQPIPGSTASVNSSMSNLSIVSPPAATTAPGPPAPGPKFSHPVSPK